jgi:hypothetical protein
MILNRISFVCFVLAALTFASGQALAVGSSTSASFRVEFTLAIVDGKVPVDVFFTDEKGNPTPVVMNSATRSPVYVYSGPQRMLLWAKGGTTGRVPFAAVNFSPDHKRALVLIMANPNVVAGQPTHLGLAVEDTLSAAPRGSLRILNLSGSDLGADLAGRQFRLGPGPSQAFNILREANAEPTFLRLARLKGDDVRMVFQGKIGATPTERITIVVLSGPNPDSPPKARILRETLKPDSVRQGM